MRAKNILLKFDHGLGDAVQLTSVLLHLRHTRPDWVVDIASLVGKHTAFYKLCRRSLVIGSDRSDYTAYDTVFDLQWPEPEASYPDSPSTKVERCLREVFGIHPDLALCRYSIRIGSDADLAASTYLRSIGCERNSDGRFNSIVIHYEGNTSRARKDLRHETAQALCAAAHHAGFVPVVLDWDRRSPLPNDRDVYCPDASNELWLGRGTGDAERLAALIQASSLFVGIDSGPQKVAGATDTPAIAVWVGHHPVHYYGMSGNVLHLCPEGADSLIRGDRDAGLAFFRKHYRSRSYSNITTDLLTLIERRLSTQLPRHEGLVHLCGFWVRLNNAHQDLVIVRDVHQQDAYRTKLQLNRIKAAQVIVDVGAHIGVFAVLCHELNPRAKIICIEACPDNLGALKANVGNFATIVHAACTYEKGQASLLNSVRPNCENTGGSMLVGAAKQANMTFSPQSPYWLDLRPLPTVSLEDVLHVHGLNSIDVLKLDCEGSEYSILRNTSSLDRVSFIVGEYHCRQRWEEIRVRELADWDYGEMYQVGNSGIFHAVNPKWSFENKALSDTPK